MPTDQPLRLPGGCYLEEKPGILVLRRSNGTVLAHFSAAQQDTREVVARIMEMILEDGDRRAYG